ncbi:MAG: N-methyl-L-tryptophan oxidase [Anaerolineae bacterium]|nr:N-methyl-L-tryptophan oxidase [Gemmatimonadaceae bacterium]
MGSAAAYQLVRRGVRVLGIDRYSPPHVFGSTHGKTRIIREAYFEHPAYVPLVRRAYELWQELEKASGQELFLQTGGLMVGPPEGMLVAGARQSAISHSLPYEELSTEEVRSRFPVLHPEEGMIALLEPRAGILYPELCVETNLALAGALGADLQYGERVVSWQCGNGAVQVTTDRGRHDASHLVLAAGPWLSELADFPLPLTVERQLFHWFKPSERHGLFHPDKCPIALWEYKPDSIFATFPDLGNGVKAGIHHDGEITTPDAVRRDVSHEDDQAMRAQMRRFVPAACDRILDSRVCLYTNTPDHHFIIDRHPEHREVIIASPCSGHGFKFSSAIGEVLADLVVAGESKMDLTLFEAGRFGKRQ